MNPRRTLEHAKRHDWFAVAIDLLVVIAAGCVAQAVLAANDTVGADPTVAQWLEDIDVLQRSFEQLHPGLYRYNTPEQVQARFDELRALARQGAGFPRMYVALSELAAGVRCGHTYTNFGNQEDGTKARLYAHRAHVPFHFRWLDGRMVVTHNFSDRPELVPGSEVLSINGVGTERILATLMRIARADGHNDDKRVDYLQVQGLNEYEAFDVYLPLYFPEIGRRQALRVRRPGEQDVRTILVEGQGHEQRRAQRRSRGLPAGVEAPDWTLEHPVPGTAVLRMSTWALYNTKWDWRSYLDGLFAELERRQTRRLVIDLRDNEGGLTEIGDAILSHLIDDSLALPPMQKRVTYRRVPADLKPYLSTWDRGFEDWGEQAVPLGPRGYRLQRAGDDGRQVVLVPAAPRFDGEVVILTSATNSSAAFEFVQRARQAGVARLVGTPTGGNQRGINGGAFFFLTLPHSRIEVDLPLIGQFPVAAMPDAGIRPDREVRTGPADIAAGRDPVMELALGAGAGP